MVGFNHPTTKTFMSSLFLPYRIIIVDQSINVEVTSTFSIRIQDRMQCNNLKRLHARKWRLKAYK